MDVNPLLEDTVELTHEELSSVFGELLSYGMYRGKKKSNIVSLDLKRATSYPVCVAVLTRGEILLSLLQTSDV